VISDASQWASPLLPWQRNAARSVGASPIGVRSRVTDEEFLSRTQIGDPESLGALFNRHSDF